MDLISPISWSSDSSQPYTLHSVGPVCLSVNAACCPVIEASPQGLQVSPTGNPVPGLPVAVRTVHFATKLLGLSGSVISTRPAPRPGMQVGSGKVFAVGQTQSVHEVPPGSFPLVRPQASRPHMAVSHGVSHEGSHEGQLPPPGAGMSPSANFQGTHEVSGSDYAVLQGLGLS